MFATTLSTNAPLLKNAEEKTSSQVNNQTLRPVAAELISDHTKTLIAKARKAQELKSCPNSTEEQLTDVSTSHQIKDHADLGF